MHTQTHTHTHTHTHIYIYIYIYICIYILIKGIKKYFSKYTETWGYQDESPIQKERRMKLNEVESYPLLSLTLSLVLLN